jgi:ankyrin repeat protein
MSFPGDSQIHLNLEQQRKRAKDLRRAHGDGNLEAAVRITRHLPRARNLSPGQVLGSTFTLSEAQFVIAREAGFLSWQKLKHHIQQALTATDAGDVIIEAAFAGNDGAARAARARDPAAAKRSIYVATAAADAEAAFALLEADPSLADRRGGRRNWTPLLYLCCSRYRRAEHDGTAARLRIAKHLLELGADVNAAGLELGYTAPHVNQMFDEHEWRPIDGAAGRVGSPELVRVLLDAGADLNQTYETVSQAVRSGNIEVLKLLLEAGPQGWWQVGWALKACVMLEKPEMARILIPYLERPRVPERVLLDAIRLERHPDLIEVLLGDDDHHELTLSIWRRAYRAAMRYGHGAAADVLRRRGADDTEVTDVDRLIAACVNQDRAEFQRLLAQSSDLGIALRDHDHRMLAWTIRTGHYRAVPLLLEAGLDPNVPDGDGETPLHLAVRANSMETVDALLRTGAWVNARNFDAETPLDVAVASADDTGRSHREMIRLLLEAGARPEQESVKLEREEMNLLFERAADAVVFGDLEALRELLDEEPALVHARSPRPHRATLLHYSGANGVEDPRQRTPSNAPAIAQLLLDRGADVNATCNLYGGGATTAGLVLSSIHPLRAGLRTALFEILLNAGATIDGARGDAGISGAAALGRLDLVKNFFDEDGRLKRITTKAQMQSAFMWACDYGRTNVVEFLLDKGADLRAQNENGQTGLHLAALAAALDTVKLLLKRQAPLEVRNMWGGTVLGNVLWAAVNHDPSVDYVPIVEAVLNAGAKVQAEFLIGWPRQNVLVPSAKPRIEELLRRYGAQ